MTKYLLIALLVLIGCSRPGPVDTVPSASGVPVDVRVGKTASPPRLEIKNGCSYDIWIQSDVAGTGAVAPVKAGATLSFDIPAGGQASARYWPKKGCDVTGQNCTMGQSSPPCPATGCQPPLDSKLEATWGCTLANKDQCGKTPQGVRMLDTFWNSSGVDGYTFPFTVAVTGGDKRASCIPVDCADLALSKCPTSEDLSNGGANPAYKNVSLVATGGAGCFSPCMDLNYPGFGGQGLNAPAGPVEQMYCCPTPPISSPACQAGPVPKTKYVELIHAACKKTSYGYAYDDGIGGRNCSGDTVISMTIGPNCP